MIRSIELGGIEYRLEEQLGEGGAGTVWLAKTDNEHYAVKKIILENEASESGRRRNERFLSEVRYCEAFHSEHVIRILASGTRLEQNKDGSSDRVLYYVMPYYRHTLRHLISGPLTVKERFALLLQLYEAVSSFHADGVIHRDLKPENILVDGNDRLVVADFGIAHFADISLTTKRESLANQWYYAPEQGKGRAASLHERRHPHANTQALLLVLRLPLRRAAARYGPRTGGGRILSHRRVGHRHRL